MLPKGDLGKGVEPQQQIINQFRRELDAQMRAQPWAPFVPTAATSEALGKLVRSLEHKRELATLTAQEARWLKDIDQLMEDVAKFNRRRSEQPRNDAASSAYQSRVYDLQGGAPKAQADEVPPPDVPKISHAAAEKIIATLNQQFEEKVMKVLKNRPPPAPPATASADAPPRGGLPNGRNLQDYLTTVRAERPAAPFADADSDMDLSKFKTSV